MNGKQMTSTEKEMRRGTVRSSPISKSKLPKAQEQFVRVSISRKRDYESICPLAKRVSVFTLKIILVRFRYVIRLFRKVACISLKYEVFTAKSL